MGRPIHIRSEEVKSWHLQDREIKDCRYRFLVDIGRSNGRNNPGKARRITLGS